MVQEKRSRFIVSWELQNFYLFCQLYLLQSMGHFLFSSYAIQLGQPITRPFQMSHMLLGSEHICATSRLYALFFGSSGGRKLADVYIRTEIELNGQLRIIAQ
jgi:hypothetical protein